MLGCVKFINFEKCYPSRLKRFFKADYNYRTYDEFVPNVKNQIIGNLPPEIINLFGGKNKAEKIKLFQKALANTALYLRQCYKTFKENNIIQKNFHDLDIDDLKLFEKDASSVLNNHLKFIVPKGIKANIEYVGKGCWKNVFKLSFYDHGEKIMHDKALQVFHSISCPIKSLKNSQGVYAESNFWTYLKNITGHKLDKTQFTRHFISDMKNGYSITEFADDNIQKTTSPLDIDNLFKIFYTDITNDPINGKLYDIGGCLKMPGFIKDKVVLKYFKKLMHRTPGKDLETFIKNLKQKVQNPKLPHRNKIQKALELFELEQNKNNQII